MEPEPFPSDPPPAQNDSLHSAREARATRYFQHDLANQRNWYSDRAKRFKKRTEILGFTVIAAGAASSFLQVFGKAPWVPIMTSLLGALVVLSEGWRQIARYTEAWTGYRVASEKMKRELRLYVNRAGEYRGVGGEEEAFLHFVEAIEAIIAEEQQLYWQKGSQNSATPPRSS